MAATWARTIALILIAVLFGSIVPPRVAVAQQAPPPPSPDLFAESMKAPAAERTTDGYDVGAGVINAVRGPGKAVVCLTGVAAGIVVFALTFGSAYQGAAAAVREGCGGKWVITGDDLRPVRGTESWSGRQSG